MKAIIDRCVQADQLGRLSLQPKADEFDLRGVLESFRVKIPNLASRLRVTLPDRLPLLQSDRQLLEIVLINLLDNASRYSDPVTPVMIDARLSRRGERAGLEVCVSNTPGLAGWPDSDRVFGKYYRSSSALSQSGTGLGLFLSRELAQTLGGSLDYAPSERLVRFVLWIPLNPT
jgi:K+-sensing histidine kinase KdpD